jgi:hypothetical protein
MLAWLGAADQGGGSHIAGGGCVLLIGEDGRAEAFLWSAALIAVGS